jgi:hypothetical protein
MRCYLITASQYPFSLRIASLSIVLPGPSPLLFRHYSYDHHAVHQPPTPAPVKKDYKHLHTTSSVSWHYATGRTNHKSQASDCPKEACSPP